MCGINVIFHFAKSRPIPGEIENMNKVLERRGPDAEGIYSEYPVEFGHRRLAIIDTSTEANQPMSSPDGNLVMVYNGELYNYRDIKNQLAGYPFKTESDSEVILAAYQKWGEHALRLFNGIFAFAIWDKARRELFIARDRLGIKPLYFWMDNDTFVASSSLRSILSTNRSSRKIGQDALVDYLRYQTVHAPKTIIEDIEVLMPGQFVRINEEDGAKFSSYWSLDTFPVSKFRSVDEVKEKVREALYKAVELQMVSDVPFGAFLSGGIDSSLLVAIMSKIRETKTDTFSIVFKEAEFSEQSYSRLIAHRYHTRHHEIELSASDFRDLIPEALLSLDHPSGDGPNTYVVSKKTRDAGIKMAISGLGGDELFGGYSIFTQLPSLRQKKWIRSFPGYARRPTANLYHRLKGTISSAKIAELLKLDDYDTEDIYQFYRQAFSDAQIAKLLKSKRLTPNRVHQIVKDLVGYSTPGWELPDLSKISVAEMSTYMQNVLLRDTDQMSMANGLEVRVPFLDHEFTELVLSIPDSVKKPETPKKLLVETFSDLLPEEIYKRPKMGFVLPYEVWMKNELRSFCEEQLNFLKNSPWFDASEVNKVWQLFLAGHKSVSWSRIWSLVVLSKWIQDNNAK